jgi:glycosyltransferase involved in cell wall biosynthesis
MSLPSFTFVLPTLNAAGPLFERALGSIRAQSYPQNRVEIIVADGGSTDDTRAVAEGFGARMIDNPNVLAEWGVKEGFAAATGEIVVIFAADNELIDVHWLERVALLFEREPDLSAVFGRLVSGIDDPALNKYIELIQSEPLNWFLNRNLEWYLQRHPIEADGFSRFDVDPARPLIWGANGLAVRRDHALPRWRSDGYVADVDAFHAMVRDGHSRVAYSPNPYCFHHQVATLRDLRRKWLRNAKQHLVEQAPTRDLEWVLTPHFRSRLALWVGYSLVPLISTGDALRRARRDRSAYWLYHPLASLLQTITYGQALASSKAGRQVVKRALAPRRG